MNVLFVCTENIARSPMAVTLVRELVGGGRRYQARTAGTAWHAPRRLTTRDLAWAHVVAAMEETHRQFIKRFWPHHVRKVVVLGVDDDFDPGDPKLREVLAPKIRTLLDQSKAFPDWAVESQPLKRTFDFVLASLGLLVSAPLWGLIALLIKLDDRGPIFFEQARVGRGGQPFMSWKFRSMITDPDRSREPLQAARDDMRITRVGRVLRATAMDELPQLWNIVRGDMSFVGPRALMPQEIEVTARGHVVSLETIPGYEERHRVTPGLTGLAQIYADRDIARRQKFRYDMLYIRKQTLWLDVRLILLSCWITLRARWEHRGAKF